MAPKKRTRSRSKERRPSASLSYIKKWNKPLSVAEKRRLDDFENADLGDERLRMAPRHVDLRTMQRMIHPEVGLTRGLIETSLRFLLAQQEEMRPERRVTVVPMMLSEWFFDDLSNSGADPGNKVRNVLTKNVLKNLAPIMKTPGMTFIIHGLFILGIPTTENLSNTSNHAVLLVADGTNKIFRVFDSGEYVDDENPTSGWNPMKSRHDIFLSKLVASTDDDSFDEDWKWERDALAGLRQAGSADCGYFVIFVVIFLRNGWPLEDIVKLDFSLVRKKLCLGMLEAQLNSNLWGEFEILLPEAIRNEWRTWI